MHVAVTITLDEGTEELRALIAAIREVLSNEDVTVLEAPHEMKYPYPLPVVTICENAGRERLYGDDALERLRCLAGRP